MVGLTSTELDDLESCTLQVYDDDTLIKEMTSTTPNDQGYLLSAVQIPGWNRARQFYQSADFLPRIKLHLRGSVDVTSEKELYEQELELQSLQDSLESNTVEVIALSRPNRKKRRKKSPK
jgi:hypothetical protein